MDCERESGRGKPRAGEVKSRQLKVESRIFAEESPHSTAPHAENKLPGGLEMLEDVGDFLASFLGVVDGDVLTLFSADRGIAANSLAGVHGGMLGNFEGLLRAIGGFHGDGLGALANIVDSALGGMDRFLAEPLDGMGGLVRAFAGRVDDDVPAFLAGEVGSLGGVLEAVDSGFLSELNRFDRAVSGFHGNGFCSGIDFFNGAGDNVGHILRAGYGDSEAGREEHKGHTEWGLKRTGSHRFSLEYGKARKITLRL